MIMFNEDYKDDRKNELESVFVYSILINNGSRAEKDVKLYFRNIQSIKISVKSIKIIAKTEMK